MTLPIFFNFIFMINTWANVFRRRLNSAWAISFTKFLLIHKQSFYYPIHYLFIGFNLKIFFFAYSSHSLVSFLILLFILTLNFNCIVWTSQYTSFTFFTFFRMCNYHFSIFYFQNTKRACFYAIATINA